MNRTKTRTVTLAAAVLLQVTARGQVLTTQYDNARTGATLNETVLTPANVSAGAFGKLFTLNVDGDVYAQPLYVPRVDIPGKGVHDVVFVATEHDSVYAFDAAGRPSEPEPLGQVSFLNDDAGVRTVPAGNTNCPFILIPDRPGQRTHLMLVGGKDGRAYVLDRDRMRREVQMVELGGGIYSSPAYWNGHVYFLASNDYLKDCAIQNGKLSDSPVARGTQKFANPGATPAVSANGTRDAIVWLIATKVWNDWTSEKRSILHAYDATNVAREIYNSEQNPARDRAGVTVRFAIPTIANGCVYVAAKRQVDVYGLLSPSR